MRYLSWLLGFALFLLALGFAVKNSAPVVIQYYLGYQWQMPLVLALLIFFAAGVVTGVTASLSFIFKQRREILSLKRELRIRAQMAEEKRHTAEQGE
jgi:uncharacterized integral membrane protein